MIKEYKVWEIQSERLKAKGAIGVCVIVKGAEWSQVVKSFYVGTIGLDGIE